MPVVNETKVAVYRPHPRPHSIEGYYRNVTNYLESVYGYTFEEFELPEQLPADAVLCWDPRGGRGAPHPRLADINIPFIATFHGAAHLSMGLHQCFGWRPSALWKGMRDRLGTTRGWHRFDPGKLNIIAVSQYAKEEFSTAMHFPARNIQVIHHGVDHEIFNQVVDDNEDGRPYFLHVSSFQPKKNIPRIVKAYHALECPDKPRLLIVCPGMPEMPLPQGVEVMRQALSHEQLVGYYRSALAFLFPSLHETFGMPILEAMASGCPVVTSNVTACPEVAGDSAILVSPGSIPEMTDALRRIIQDRDYRLDLREKGLRRAASFSWSESARSHHHYFLSALAETSS